MDGLELLNQKLCGFKDLEWWEISLRSPETRRKRVLKYKEEDGSRETKRQGNKGKIRIILSSELVTKITFRRKWSSLPEISKGQP